MRHILSRGYDKRWMCLVIHVGNFNHKGAIVSWQIIAAKPQSGHSKRWLWGKCPQNAPNIQVYRNYTVTFLETKISPAERHVLKMMFLFSRWWYLINILMDVSENTGCSPQIIHGLIGFSIIIHHPFWGKHPYFLETPIEFPRRWLLKKNGSTWIISTPPSCHPMFESFRPLNWLGPRSWWRWADVNVKRNVHPKNTDPTRWCKDCLKDIMKCTPWRSPERLVRSPGYFMVLMFEVDHGWFVCCLLILSFEKFPIKMCGLGHAKSL